MRLINTQDFSLIEVHHPEDHPYAILSHTWNAEGEVTLNDMKSLEVARTKIEWPKVKWTCALAAGQGIGFAWIDTCCIDKSSSAELTEAINSMFEWYRKAVVCYTYLQDLPKSRNSDPESARAREQVQEDLTSCKWFSRGWTLQELIAPKVVEFYDCSWIKRGTKKSLRFDIARITNVDMSVLSNSENLSTIPVARKMSWAANRRTTRVEDMAYSLLGIFDVNLPLIYGEGNKAFIRLQEAIALLTNDLSLFAWLEDERNPSRQSYYGVLAQHPRQFVTCRHLERIEDPLRHDNQSFTMTNRGVEFQTSLKMDLTKQDYIMPLYCRDSSVQQTEARLGMISIRLIKTSSGFARHQAGKVFVDNDESTSNWDPFIRSVHITKITTPADSLRLNQRFNEAFRFLVQSPPGVTYKVTTHNTVSQKADLDSASMRPSYWDPTRRVFLTEGYQYFTGMVYITFSVYPEEPFIILCGFLPTQAGMKPWVALQPHQQTSWQSAFDPATLVVNRLGLAEIVSQKTYMHHPRFLARAGQIIRANLDRGKTVPTRAKATGGRRYQRVSASVTSEVTKLGRIHDIIISLQ